MFTNINKLKNDILSLCLILYIKNTTVAILAQDCCGSIPPRDCDHCLASGL